MKHLPQITGRVTVGKSPQKKVVSVHFRRWLALASFLFFFCPFSRSALWQWHFPQHLNLPVYFLVAAEIDSQPCNFWLKLTNSSALSKRLALICAVCTETLNKKNKKNPRVGHVLLSFRAGYVIDASACVTEWEHDAFCCAASEWEVRMIGARLLTPSWNFCASTSHFS